MNTMTTRKTGADRNAPVKRRKLRRVARVCEAPRRGRRWLRMCGWSLCGLSGFLVAAALCVYVLFLTGLVTVDIARPYVERALADRLGPGKKVEIGEITSGRTADGGWDLLVSNIVIRDDGGDVIATAPRAELVLQDRWMPWMAGPKRIDLIGVKLQIWINAQGELTVSTGDNAKPIAAPVPHPAPLAANQSAAPGSATPGEAANPAPVGPVRMASLAALADNLDKAGLDGGALSDIGLKDGVLVLRSEVSGRSWTFENIDLNVARPVGGGLTFDLKAGGTDGPWSARATIGPLQDGHRDIGVAVRDLAPRDLMIAAGMAEADLVATSPLSGEINAEIDAHGQLVGSSGRLLVGAGELQVGKDQQGRMIIDEVMLDFGFDPNTRVIAIKPLTIHAGPLDMEVRADVQAPDAADGVWRLHTTAAHGTLGGGGRFSDKEPPFVASDIQLEASFDIKGKRLSLDTAKVSGPQGGVTVQGALDLGAAEPNLQLNVASTPVSVATLKRIWPVLAAPDVRNWVFDHIISGDVSKAEIALKAPLSSIGTKDNPLADEGLRIDIAGTNGAFRPIPELPGITNAQIALHVTGRTAHAVVNNGALQTPGGRKLTLTQGVLDISDTAQTNPMAKLQLTLDGAAAAMAELGSMPPLSAHAAAPLDPTKVSGTFHGVAQVSVKLSNDIQEKDVDFAFDANLTNFSADDLVLGRKLDDATVQAFVTPQANVFRGDGKFGGAPVSFEYNRPVKGDATFTAAASLDSAARDKLDMDLAGLDGTVAVKLNGTVGANSKVLADVDVDLVKARLAELVPGWSKPAGKPARMTAKLNVSSNGTKLDDLVITGSGVNIRGTVVLDAKASLVSADLPTFQLSDGDKASVKVDQSGGVMKITVRGEVIEARAFLKGLLEAPIAGNASQAKPADIDLDINLNVVVGNNGETMRQAVLQLSRRDGALKAFSLGALVGRDSGVTGQLMNGTAGSKPILRVATTDAGALLRFIDFYPRIFGGDLWVDVDPPSGTNAPQNGVINMRDFVIRGEPGLDRLLAAAPAKGADGRPQPGGAVSFRKLQVTFTRSAEQLTIRDGVVWGPSIGSTFDGTLDYARDRISVQGTYVPAFGLNNLFSRLPVLGFFLGGGPNEGLVGVTYEVVGPLSGPTLRVNPISAVAPGFLRKIFEYRQAPDPTPPAVIPSR